MNRTAAALLLLVATFFWGMTFAVVKGAVAGVGVYVFLSQRFVVAFVVLAAIAGRGGQLPDRGTLVRGLVLGAVLFPVYATQTVALRFTSASNAAFISGLGIVIVPVLAALLLRERTGGGLWAAIGLAVVGLLLLTTGGRWEGTLNRGDLLSGACALCIALHLVLAARFAPRGHIAWLAALQVGVVALGSLVAAAVRGERLLVWHPELLWPLAFCALLGTVFAFLALMAAQRVLSPTHTAVIVCMEPVFAALWAWLTTGERLTAVGYLGGALILAAMLLAEIVVNRCKALGRGCRV
jgi:drug/metabolite transporter (DMT)-like permease